MSNNGQGKIVNSTQVELPDKIAVGWGSDSNDVDYVYKGTPEYDAFVNSGDYLGPGQGYTTGAQEADINNNSISSSSVGSVGIPMGGISSAISGLSDEQILSAVNSATSDNNPDVSNSSFSSSSVGGVGIPMGGISSAISGLSSEQIMSAVNSATSDNNEDVSNSSSSSSSVSGTSIPMGGISSAISGLSSEEVLSAIESSKGVNIKELAGSSNAAVVNRNKKFADYNGAFSNPIGVSSFTSYVKDSAKNNKKSSTATTKKSTTPNNSSVSSISTAIAVPSYSYNRGVISLVDDSSNIDFLRKEIIEKFNTLSSYAYNQARITYTADSAYSSEVVGTVTEFPLRPFCNNIFGGIPTQNGNYISSLISDFVEMTTLANNSVDYNDEFFYYCGSLSQITAFAQNGRVFTSQGYTVEGTNPGYYMVNSLITDVNHVVAKKCNFFKLFYEKLLQHNLEIVRNLSTKINSVDLENSVYNSVYGYIRGTSRNHIKFYVNSGRQDYLFDQFISTHWNKVVSDFNSIKNKINTLKAKLESFCSYYDISIWNKNTDYYEMPKYDGSNTQQFTGNTDLLSNDLNSLNSIYSSLKMPNSGNLRFVVSGRTCFSGSGLSTSISEIDSDLLNLKKSFENLTGHVEKVIKGINDSDSQTTDVIANEVIRGNWGVGAERKRKLEAAGYNYDEIQARVNQILLGTGATVTTGTSSVVANISNITTTKAPTTQYRVQDTNDSVTLATTRKEYLEKLEKTQKEADAKIAKLKEQQAKEIEKLKKEQAIKTEKLKQQQEKELAKLKEQQKQQEQQALKDKEAQQQEIEKLKQEQAKEIEKLKQEQAQEIEKLKQEQAQEIEKIKQDAANEIEKLKQEAQTNNVLPNNPVNNTTTNKTNTTTSTVTSSNVNNNSTIGSDSTGNSSAVANDNSINNDSEYIFNTTEKPSYTTTTRPNKVVQTSDKSGNAGVVGAVLGIGALGAAGVVGARYIKKKKENETYSDDENYFSNDEEFSEVKEDEIEESSPKYKAGSVNDLVLDDSSDIDTTNSNITSSDILDFE